MQNYWNTPTHAGARTPRQMARKAAHLAAALLVTAATLAAFTALFIIFN